MANKFNLSGDEEAAPKYDDRHYRLLELPWMLQMVNDRGNCSYQVRTVEPHNPAGKVGIQIGAVLETNPYVQARMITNFGSTDQGSRPVVNLSHYIIRAANSYPALLAACQAVVDAHDSESRQGLLDSAAKCREALKVAAEKIREDVITFPK